MALMMEAKGGNGGKQWDDGFDYDGVTKIHVRGGLDGIQFIKFDYVKAGKTIEGPIHGVTGRGMTQTYEVKHSDNNYLLSVEGYYDKSTGVIQSIQFKTNNETSDLMGFNEGTKFSLSAPRRRIIGFHGFSEKNLNSLGAYFLRIPSTKSAMEGGQTTGKSYDHGGDYDGIRKVYVTHDGTSIRHMRVDYVKAGQVECYEYGDKIGTQYEFYVNYPNESITSVEGSYAVTQPYGCIVLRSLVFKTSSGRTSTQIGKPNGTNFVLESKGNAIIGFHGRVGSCVDSIGAYYSPLTPYVGANFTKSAMEGGQNTGKGYDHGGEYSGIRKVYVTHDGTSVRHIRVDYDRVGQIEWYEHGEKIGTLHEFEVNYPNESITFVGGSYAVTEGYGCIVLRSLIFKTSSGRTSPQIGAPTGTNFVLESKGNAIIGFHGRVGSCVDSIGAYYAPFTRSPPPSVKLEGQGGEGGDSWDDGAFKNVKKVYIGQGDVGIVAVKFEYENEASEVVVGDEHGKPTLLSYEEFKLDYPDEYIISVEACFDKVKGAESGVITMLKFKTNHTTSPPFGIETTTKFVLQKEGHKITGFHGNSSNVLNEIGVHVVPITE